MRLDCTSGEPAAALASALERAERMREDARCARETAARQRERARHSREGAVRMRQRAVLAYDDVADVARRIEAGPHARTGRHAEGEA